MFSIHILISSGIVFYKWNILGMMMIFISSGIKKNEWIVNEFFVKIKKSCEDHYPKIK